MVPTFPQVKRCTNALNKGLGLNTIGSTACHLDTKAGGREFESRVEPIRANLPTSLFQRTDRHRVLLVNCRCKPNKELHRTSRGNTEQHLAWELAIALT